MLTPIVLRFLLLLSCIAALPLLFVLSDPKDDAAWPDMTRAQKTGLMAWIASNVLLCVVYASAKMASQRGRMSQTSAMTMAVAAVFILANASVFASRTFMTGQAARMASLIVICFSAGLAFLNISFIVYNVRDRIRSSLNRRRSRSS